MNIIKLSENISWEEKIKAIETSLIMGFNSISAEFPVVSRDKGIDIPSDLSELEFKPSLSEEDWPEDYVSATKNAKPILEYDWRKKKGLESMFTMGEFLKDENFDQLPDKLNFKIRISKEADLSILIAACNFAFRYGMETTKFEGSIIAEEDYEGNLLVFEESSDVGMERIEEKNREIIRVFGQGKELEEFSAHICETFPLLPEGRTWVDQLQNITDSFSMRNLDGQITYLKAYKEELKEPITGYMSPEIEDELDKVKEVFPEVEFKSHKSLKKVYKREYDISWEVDDFKKILKEDVISKLKEDDEIEIYGALSENMKIREDLVNEIKKDLEKAGVSLKNIEIINAYKQGFSWVEEIIIPKLKDENIESLQIGFKPFLPKGEVEWLDEDGATPSYNNVDTNNPEKWFDLPIRYLQELYPIDDVISEELNIPKDNIEFVLYEGEEDITYELKAVDAKDEVVLESKYKASYSERPYLDDFPQLGKVHPSTGYIKVIVNGKELINKRVKTDLEKIWEIYQEKVLPECIEFIEEKMDGKIDVESQPLFSQLRLEINASEEERRLPFREDMISPLNSFHEDMYFVGADYFKNYGIKNGDVILDAPGLILPVINEKPGKPSFKVTLYDEVEKFPTIKGDNKSISNKLDRKETELYLEEIRYEEDKVIASLRTNITDEKLIESYISLLDKEILEISSDFIKIDELEIKTEDNSFIASIKERVEPEKDLSILDIDLKESTLIGYDLYIEIIEKLKRVPGINVYEVARSYLGRKIYAIEILPNEKGYVSKTKRITELPSEMINARHHANEVSGTNAAFILLKKILTEEKYSSLPDKMNLVIVPLENVDGTEIHYELQKDNPYWKLHVARFNAIGKEFYHEHFNPDTIHTEAMGLTRIWHKWLPDILVDNHGVPSHEWEQQFSGYTSPSYKGFWLPRSLLYGYFWTIENEEYKSNYVVNKKMEEIIAEKIAEDEEMTSWNKIWMEIFEKYAHSWMPKLFPADYFNNMINYWISFEYDKNHRYPSIRFPWITTVAYTSEVADETAHGEYLNLCARAHVAHDEATIDMIMKGTCIFERDFEIKEDKIKVKNIRHRPIVVDNI